MTQDLLSAAAAGDRDRVLALLPTMDAAARRGAVRALTTAWRELPEEWVEPARERRAALEVAVLGCHTAPAGAAAWILRVWRRDDDHLDSRLLPVLADRDPAWLADVAHRLAAALRVRPTAEWPYGGMGEGYLFALIDELLRHSADGVGRSADGPERSVGGLPSGEGFVTEWALALWQRSRDATPFRADTRTPVLLPRLMEVTGLGTFLDRSEFGDVLASLTESGEIARGTLIELCAGRLLIGGKPGETRGLWKLLDAIGPTEEELVGLIPDWSRLAATGETPVAGRAQAILQRLWEAGHLDALTLAETSREVLVRPERVVVRAQLKLLAGALRRVSADAAGPRASAASRRTSSMTTAPHRAPADVAVLLPAIAVAFGHDDSAVQEQAWKLVAAHADAADDEVRAAATLLTPDLAARAAGVLGLSSGASSYEETLPPISVPRRLDPAPDSVVALAQEVAALLASRSPSPAGRERVLDGLVRHARHDREKLAAELRHVVRADRHLPDELRDLLMAVLERRKPGAAPPPGMTEGDRHHRCAHCVFDGAWLLRAAEAARRILTDPVPYLLATPVHETGVIDADVLLERLTGYARDGVRAGHADLDQALLRVRLDEDRERISAAATALGTPDAARFARWLDGGGILAGRSADDPATRLPALRDGFSDGFAMLDDRLRAEYHYDLASGALPRWLTVVPVYREYIAAQIDAVAGWEGYDAFVPDLPLLAEADGPAGPLTDKMIAKLVARGEPAHAFAITDALLQLAARGDLDPARCGAIIGGSNRYHAADDTPPEVAALLGDLARTGAYQLVWGLLQTALPGLIDRPRRPQRLNAVLSLAADCVSRTGATGAVPGLDALADSGGSSQTVKQAKRLRDCLAAGQ
ncbi:DUF7824 domain-containing protein [Catenuloplanes japonicus]|uniref:DUF7824 domain-containing protein n=1 Tax=Catenuloplanes japonicus TaxID=33876 RepID=UPI0005274C71|nr:hypothetical protein [Catenuloplanes japonicus]